MDKPMPDFFFKGMTLLFKVRDFFSPREKVLREAGVKPGFHVLDYGCGPGAYLVSLAELVGQSGKIYALDIHSLAIEKVKNIASKKKLNNVETILSDCHTGLPDSSIDVVLLYDTFHHLSDPAGVMKELHRVLKPGGILSFSDHHMKEDEILSKVTSGSLFRLSRRGKKTYAFLKGEENSRDLPKA